MSTSNKPEAGTRSDVGPALLFGDFLKRYEPTIQFTALRFPEQHRPDVMQAARLYVYDCFTSGEHVFKIGIYRKMVDESRITDHAYIWRTGQHRAFIDLADTPQELLAQYDEDYSEPDPVLIDVMASLTDIERNIIHMRFYDDVVLSEIGAYYERTESWACQKTSKIISKMARRYERQRLLLGNTKRVAEVPRNRARTKAGGDKAVLSSGIRHCQSVVRKSVHHLRGRGRVQLA